MAWTKIEQSSWLSYGGCKVIMWDRIISIERKNELFISSPILTGNFEPNGYNPPA